MKINTKQSYMVRPATLTPETKLWCSNLDMLVARIHILTIYIYRPENSSPPKFFDMEVMKKALSNVLVLFYPMAGRLGRDENGRIEIDCNGEGVLLVEAEADSSLDDIGDFTPRLELKKLVPPLHYSGDISSYPLVVLQVTRFKCGGVALGTGVHHTLADGGSALHFINTWSDMANDGGASVVAPPFVDRTLLRARLPPTPKFEHIEYHQPPFLKIIEKPKLDQDQKEPNNKSISTSILKITLEQIDLLKSKSSNEGTTFEVLAAHIWRCACNARGLSDDQLTKLHIAIDGRSRLSPPLPQGYLGNVVFNATSTYQSGDLQSELFKDSVKRIHNALARMDDEYLKSAIDYLENEPDLSALVRGPNYFRSPNLNINSWARLPLNIADFGWGNPVHVGPACILYEGTIYIMGSPSNDRSLSLAVCLDVDHMPIFKKLLYDI